MVPYVLATLYNVCMYVGPLLLVYVNKYLKCKLLEKVYDRLFYSLKKCLNINEHSLRKSVRTICHDKGHTPTLVTIDIMISSLTTHTHLPELKAVSNNIEKEVKLTTPTRPSFLSLHTLDNVNNVPHIYYNAGSLTRQCYIYIMYCWIVQYMSNITMT